jgi:hypothetical protein
MRHVVWGGVLGGGASGVVVSLVVADHPFAGHALDLIFIALCFAVPGAVVGVASDLLSWGAGCLVTLGRPESRARAVVTVAVASVLGGASAASVLLALGVWSSLGGEAIAGVVVGAVGGAAGAGWAVWMSQGTRQGGLRTSTAGDGGRPAA